MTRGLTSFVLAVATAAACSPSQSASGPIDGTTAGSSDGTVAIDATTVDALSAQVACTSLAMARCMKLMTCSPADLTHRFGTEPECEARELLACEAGLAAPDTAANGDGAEACGSAITAATCAEFFGTEPITGCAPMGSGEGTCAFAAQCDTSFCSVPQNGLCGVCQTAPVAGASCQANGCGPGLVCDGNNNLCAAPAEAGAQCNKTIPCDHGLACVGDTNQHNGQCMPTITTAGAACDQTRKNRADCSGDSGLTCNTNNNQCVTQPYVAAGSACGPINGVETNCSAGATCVIANGKTTGTCVAPAGDGSACDTKAGPDCLAPARCIPVPATGTAGTCQLPGSQAC